MIDPNILTGLMYVGSVFLFGTRGYWGLTLFFSFYAIMTDSLMSVMMTGGCPIDEQENGEGLSTDFCSSAIGKPRTDACGAC